MTHKQVLFGSGAREKTLRGVTALADAVRVTLGPKSKCVLIEKRFGVPIVCNDGVTIAKEMVLEDPAENLGAQMIRQAAERTGDAVGDGTSTATILAHAIYAEGIKNVVAGASAVDGKRGLDRGLRVAVISLRELSRPVKSRRERAQVAALSAHNDPAIGELVADAMEKVGDEGVITLEESKMTQTQVEVVEGMQFDRGYISPYFITDAEKMEVYDREKLQERLAKLSGGVAVVRVGAPSESEMKSRREALDDAIAATKAAVAEGIVPGGGLALLRAIPAVEKEEGLAEGDERTGLSILRRALETPTRQIAENSAVDGGVVVEKMRTGIGAMGFDAARKQYVDLIQEPAHRETPEGHPADMIAAAAEGNTDLVVVGARGLGGIKRRLLGSVSENVLRAARCPVLIVKRPLSA